ncbi:nitroreductase family protein [Bacillus sp. FJAT-29814]|uniref:nitroreductase family protein n=1 Tax=Bacillus sp. FJAT-29814 TaxID=1729688 RepID=UPI000B26D9BB|nr:nitroreductase family protein [Bacillus sp. FJAT-29814]
MENSVIEMMQKRHSIRTYESKPLSESDLNKITEYIDNEDNLVGPLGGRGLIELVLVRNNVTNKGVRLGTYGFIKNPQAYLVGITENNKMSLLDFAYIFEKLVLYLTELGLGSCWMGGTFNRHSFERAIDIPKGKFIPCITPIGYPHRKQRLFDTAVRIAVKADNKKPWDRLFYYGKFGVPLTREKAGPLAIPIEMVRLGPSASNKQPWRLVLSEDKKSCHFFLEHTPSYSTSLGYDMQLLDMGIAMCQYELACQELNILGQWVSDDPKLDLPNGQIEYMISWKMA